jgi:hypothetical protein
MCSAVGTLPPLQNFTGLSLGPANVVVPIYGMFIVGGSLLGVLFLGEPMTWHKLLGSPPPSSAWCSSRFSKVRVVQRKLSVLSAPLVDGWQHARRKRESGFLVQH